MKNKCNGVPDSVCVCALKAESIICTVLSANGDWQVFFCVQAILTRSQARIYGKQHGEFKACTWDYMACNNCIVSLICTLRIDFTFQAVPFLLPEKSEKVVHVKCWCLGSLPQLKCSLWDFSPRPWELFDHHNKDFLNLWQIASNAK